MLHFDDQSLLHVYKRLSVTKLPLSSDDTVQRNYIPSGAKFKWKSNFEYFLFCVC